MPQHSCLELEIGATLGDLLNLRMRGLPDVTSWTFAPYSRTEVRGDGRSVGFGFAQASWNWEILSQDQLNVLLSFFATETDASVLVYIWTYCDSGRGTGDMRKRYYGIMHRPIDGSGKTMVADSRTPMYEGVLITFTHLTEV